MEALPFFSMLAGVHPISFVDILVETGALTEIQLSQTLDNSRETSKSN